ncbi:hypothetical protein JCM16303_002962 [Sporobolomyces ruberrimus]
MASTTASAAAPVFPCPYTAGGCPLFNTIDIPKPQTPTCAGGCSPSSSTSTAPPPSDASLKLRPISPQRAPTPARLPPLNLEFGAPRPRSPTTASAREWNGYLEFGLQPSEVDLAPLYVPFPQGTSPPQLQASTSKRTASLSSGGGLWDIEELVPSAKKPRTASVPELPLPEPHRATNVLEVAAPSGLVLPFDQARDSPSSSEDGFANEVVTPFISKLNYLLDHQEYEPWIRWDASGTYILIAHTKPRLLEILARYFRHTTIASFVRQLNIYGFKRVTTVSLLSILDSSSLPQTIHVPPSSTPSSSTNSPDLSTSSSSTTSTETFSASDYSAFHNAQFFRSTSGPNGTSCRLGALKPITKERPPRNRSKKAKAEAAEAKRKREIDEGEIFA